MQPYCIDIFEIIFLGGDGIHLIFVELCIELELLLYKFTIKKGKVAALDLVLG